MMAAQGVRMKKSYKWIAAENTALNNVIRMIGAVSAVFLIITQSGCGSKTAEPVSKQSFYFDTVCSVSVYDMEEMSEEEYQKILEQREEDKKAALEAAEA